MQLCCAVLFVNSDSKKGRPEGRQLRRDLLTAPNCGDKDMNGAGRQSVRLKGDPPLSDLSIAHKGRAICQIGSARAEFFTDFGK